MRQCAAVTAAGSQKRSTGCGTFLNAPDKAIDVVGGSGFKPLPAIGADRMAHYAPGAMAFGWKACNALIFVTYAPVYPVHSLGVALALPSCGISCLGAVPRAIITLGFFGVAPVHCVSGHQGQWFSPLVSGFHRLCSVCLCGSVGRYVCYGRLDGSDAGAWLHIERVITGRLGQGVVTPGPTPQW